MERHSRPSFSKETMVQPPIELIHRSVANTPCTTTTAASSKTVLGFETPTSTDKQLEDGIGIHSGSGSGFRTPQEGETPRHEFPVLPPVDGGKEAWLFLGACFVLELLVWGM